jgi:hypothetical protein
LLPGARMCESDSRKRGEEKKGPPANRRPKFREETL